MFKGEKSKTNNDSPERLNRLVSGTELEGGLKTESNLRVDGRIIGNTQCNGKFVLGEKGIVNGNLNATTAELEGTVDGDIVIEDLLILRKTAIIKGGVSTARLIIEDGAQIGGSIQTGDIPVKNLKNNNSKIEKKTESIKSDEEVESDIVY
jgi:cytoskeletal protein CcmA (bactofilin family)